MNDAHSSVQYKKLKDYFRELDIDYSENQRKRNLVIEGKLHPSILHRIFLRKKEQEGKLQCVYCQKQLKRYIFERKTKVFPADAATIDHFVAVHNGGLKYHYSNFVVACIKCNNDKGILPAFKISEDKSIF